MKVQVTIKNVSFPQMDAESKEELRAALQTTIADKAGVDETAVNVTLAAGSVKVSAVIDLEERIGIMEGESEGQDLDLMHEMESLKDEVQSELETGDVKEEILTVASSLDGVQLAAEGEISITDPEIAVTAQVTSTPTKMPSLDGSTTSELLFSNTSATSSVKGGGQPISSLAAQRYNTFATLLIGSVACVLLP